MRTATYASWLARFESLVGIEQGTIQTDEALAALGFFQRGIKRIWEAGPWLETCLIEERTPDGDGLIDWEQGGETEIGEVFAVYETDPYATSLPRRVGYALTRDGIQIIGTTTESTVWVHFRERCPTYTTSDSFPYIFFEYVLRAAYAEWLRSDGQNDKAAQADAQAEEIMQQELDKLQRQQGVLLPFKINTHLTSRT